MMPSLCSDRFQHFHIDTEVIAGCAVAMVGSLLQSSEFFM
jgi:hypothetical protein